MSRFLGPACALVLLVSLTALAAPEAPPEARPQREAVLDFTRFDASALRRALDGPPSSLPGATCASSPELDLYLEQLHRLALKNAALKRAAADGPTEAAGDFTYRDGLWVAEADDTMLLHDRPADLEGQTLRFTPATGGGYDVALVDYAYDGTLGTLELDNDATVDSVQVNLANFSFPLGSGSYSTLFVDRDLGVRTNDPTTAPEPNAAGTTQFGQNSAALLAHLFDDQADRLSPFFHTGPGNIGRFIYVRDLPEKVLITWQRWDDPNAGLFYFDVQAALYPDGTIEFSYKELRNYDNGSPSVLTDIGSWFSSFVQKVNATDPVDPVVAAADIVNLEVLDGPSSDAMRFRMQLNTAIPETIDPDVTYYLDLNQGGSLRYRFYFNINVNGRSPLYVYSASADAWTYAGQQIVSGDTWDVFVSLADLPDLSAGTIDYYAHTYEAGEFRDDMSTSGATDGGFTFVRDYSVEAPFTSTIPTIETFLFPELNVFGVKQAFFAHTGWDETIVDGLPIYQDFFTDIVFYAGAYYTGGNCGAANIGRCDPGNPLRPGLLHMNKTGYGWNNPTETYRFQVLSHELGHHWLQNIQIDEGAGPTNVLNPQSAHPAAYVHTEAAADLVQPEDTSVMGGGYWTDNGDGSFTTPMDYTYYSFADYELYLMGLKEPTEVASWYYLENEDPAQPLSYWPQPDVTVTADKHAVDINMVLSAMGTRDPVYPTAKQDFFAPLILLVRPGQTVSTEAWDFMMAMRHPWRDAFRTQTDQRGTSTTVTPREVSPVGDGQQLRVEKRAGDELRFFFEDADFADQARFNLYEGSLGGSFDGWSQNNCGVDGTASGSELYLDATPGVAGSAYFLITMSTRFLEGEPGNDSAGSGRSTTETVCGPY